MEDDDKDLISVYADITQTGFDSILDMIQAASDLGHSAVSWLIIIAAGVMLMVVTLPFFIIGLLFHGQTKRLTLPAQRLTPKTKNDISDKVVK
jgi:hypothetical protein